MGRPNTNWRDLAPYLIALIPLLGWWTYGLLDLDEGFYAAVTSEMLRRGEWITPHYNGSPWFEKPILLYWLAKPCVALFGEMIGPRLPSVLANLALCVLCASFLKRTVTEDVAKRTVLVLGTCFLFAATGRMMLTDPLLVLTLSGALMFFWRSLTEGQHWISNRVISAALLGFSVLAKGPVGGAIFLIIAGITYWRQPDLRPAFRGGWLAGTGILLGIVATWYVPAYLANGDLFVQKFLIEQNVGRFSGGDQAHRIGGIANWIFYLPVLLLGMAPWSFRLVGAMRKAWQPDTTQAPLRRFLATWAIVIFAFFTVSGSKLPHYILPAVPPLAMLLALYWADRRPVLSWPAPTLGALGLAAFLQFGFSGYHGGLQLGSLRLPGFHAEVQRLARTVRKDAKTTDDVVVYQMPRRSKDRGTGKLKIQETSHPSLLLYLNRSVIEAESLAELTESRKTAWIITRTGRIGPVERAQLATAGYEVVEIGAAQADLYRLYRITPSSGTSRLPFLEVPE